MTVKRCCPSVVEVSPGLSPCGLLALLAMVVVMPIGAAGLLGAEAPKEQLPAPEELTGQDFLSKGLQLSATFYPGTNGKDSVPVILNLQSTSADLSKRLIDFSSGLTYALDGGMQKIADKTFMLTPANVEVSAEEKARLVEKGFFNQS